MHAFFHLKAREVPPEFGWRDQSRAFCHLCPCGSLEMLLGRRGGWRPAGRLGSHQDEAGTVGTSSRLRSLHLVF